VQKTWFPHWRPEDIDGKMLAKVAMPAEMAERDCYGVSQATFRKGQRARAD
jgi:hypothetical protein